MIKPAFGEYYVADVSWGPSNPIHRVIAVCNGEGNGFSLLCSGYESVRRVFPSRDLHYFRLVRSIGDMKSSLDMPPKQKTIEEAL